MRTSRTVELISAALLTAAVLLARTAPGQPATIESQPTTSAPASDLDRLIRQLGDDDYAVRDRATRALFRRGPGIEAELRARLPQVSDPEIRRRIEYVLANLRPPAVAVLLVRPGPGIDLPAGTVITHCGGVPVPNPGMLRILLADRPGTLTLRYRTPEGPGCIEAPPVDLLGELAYYSRSRGPIIAQAVDLYARGYAERAYELLQGLPQPVPTNELPKALLARIAYTAGDADRALKLIEGQTQLVRTTGTDAWSGPSYLDKAGPGKAPLHLELVLARAARQAAKEPSPVTLAPHVERVLLLAHRYVDNLTTAARRFNDLFDPQNASQEELYDAGNSLAIVAWMLHLLELHDEARRLVNPRSAFLRKMGVPVSGWLRVDTDAWGAFFAGNEQQALDGFYANALEVLRNPPRPGSRLAAIRQPEVAAQLAVFLYHFPEDRRVREVRELLSRPDHPALRHYLFQMLTALRPENRELVRNDFQTLLACSDSYEMLRPLVRAALLEYTRPAPDQQVFQRLRRRASRIASTELHPAVVLIDALAALAAGRFEEARRLAVGSTSCPGFDVIQSTVEFLQRNGSPPGQPRVLVAVPADQRNSRWLVLFADDSLAFLEPRGGTVTPVAAPAEGWLPNPLTWPWLGYQSSTGATWAYDVCRLINVAADGTTREVLNVQPTEIERLHPLFAGHYDQVCALAEGYQPSPRDALIPAERLRAHQRLTVAPDVPEVSSLRDVPNAPWLTVLTLRGVGQLLIDTSRGRCWSSNWFCERLDLRPPLRFFARALPLQPDGSDGDITVMLATNQGLLKFTPATGELHRIPLPGDEPFPPVIPESTPYDRRDPRWFYVARLPAAGGQVYRLTLADGEVTPLTMVNESLPEDYYHVLARGELRDLLDEALARVGLPGLEEFVCSTVERVQRWEATDAPPTP